MTERPQRPTRPAARPATRPASAPAIVDEQEALTNDRASTPFGRPGGDDDFIINLDGANLNGGRPSAGVHLSYISGIEKGTSKADNPMITWTITVYDGPDAGKSGKVYTALTTDAFWKLVECCDAIGFEIPEDKKIRFGDLKEAALRTIVEAEVIDTTYNGAPSTSINRLYAPESGAGEKIPDPSIPR